MASNTAGAFSVGSGKSLVIDGKQKTREKKNTATSTGIPKDVGRERQI